MLYQYLFHRFVAMLVLVLAAANPAHAENDQLNIIDELTVWYAAHTDAMAPDVAVGLVDAALAPDVRIELKAFGVVQNKSEYLDSFGGWQDAIEGGLVAPRVEAIDRRTARVLVCYVFESNSLLNRETVTFNDDMQINSLIADQISETCPSP